MHDEWTDRLSDHMDGLLDAGATRDLLAHLDECAECRAIEAELRAVVAAAHTAPVLEPARDLWSGIAARLVDTDSSAAVHIPIPRPAHDRTVPPHASGRRFSFSLPQLAAAAVILMTLTGTAVWMVRGGTEASAVASGTIIQNAGAETGSTRTVAAAPAPADMPGYTEDVADLELALDQNRAQLDRTTVEVIERSLIAIDNAIADARTALQADPGNPHLHRQLDNTMRKKIDILRRATRVQRADS